MSNLKGLKNKIDALEELNNFNNEEDVDGIKQRVKILMEVASALVGEIEKLDFIRPIKIRKGINLREEMRGFETHLIQTALKQTGGHQTHAAKLLGVSHTTLSAKIKRFGISTNMAIDSRVLNGKTAKTI